MSLTHDMRQDFWPGAHRKGVITYIVSGARGVVTFDVTAASLGHGDVVIHEPGDEVTQCHIYPDGCDTRAYNGEAEYQQYMNGGAEALFRILEASYRGHFKAGD